MNKVAGSETEIETFTKQIVSEWQEWANSNCYHLNKTMKENLNNMNLNINIDEERIYKLGKAALTQSYITTEEHEKLLQEWKVPQCNTFKFYQLPTDLILKLERKL